MGLDYNGVRLMAYTKTLDSRLNSVAMLGRQSLHTNSNGIRAIFDEFKIKFIPNDLHLIVNHGGGYCESLLNHMGFGSVESFDFSNYENPTHVHDFNQPIPPEFDRRYDLVLDGGSLEHIFNFPTALRNSMRMVKPGGIFVTITPCNNYCGHGFYQFSPELYFSLMRRKNGYKLLDLFCHEIGEGMKWHRAVDPDAIKNRVNLVTRKPIMMLVIARRLENSELPEFEIQQSDYETLWAGDSLKRTTQSKSNLSFVKHARRLGATLVPNNLKNRIWKFLEPESFASPFFSDADENRDSLLKSAIAAQKES